MTRIKSVTLNKRKLKYIKKNVFNEYLFIICLFFLIEQMIAYITCIQKSTTKHVSPIMFECKSGIYSWFLVWFKGPQRHLTLL